MIKKNNYSLKLHNTFQLESIAKNYIRIEEKSELFELDYTDKFFIMGGGSNLLLPPNIYYTILHIKLNGKKILKETDEHIYLQVAAGENWDDLVKFSTQNNWQGLENLSYIPGTVGSSPVQNIGAYGTEAKDYIYHVEVFDTKYKTFKILKNLDCKFDYRYSIFKNHDSKHLIVTSVVYKLNKKPKFNLSYGFLKNLDAQKQTPQTIRQKVIDIRKSKLPDYKKLGNAGSFFKNPIINIDLYNDLLQKFPDIKGFQVSDTQQIKVPAGWLIEKAGWKGKHYKNASVYQNQALILCNTHGKAKYTDITMLAEYIKTDVLKKFNILLEPEVIYL